MSSLSTQFQRISAIDHAQMKQSKADYLPTIVTQVVELIFSLDHQDFKSIKQFRGELLAVGVLEQQVFEQLNQRLIHPLQQLINDIQAGGLVASLLDELNKKMAVLQPPNKKQISLKKRFMLLFSLEETPLQLWLEQYPDAQQSIQHLLSKLTAAKKQLQRDNKLLSKDQMAMDAGVEQLENCFDYLCLLETSLQNKHPPTDAATAELNVLHQVITTEFLPAIQQRIITLQQQLLIVRQAVMTLELIQNQNHSLIAAIENAALTTTAALKVSASLALANSEQRTTYSKSMKQAMDLKKFDEARSLINQAINKLQQTESHLEQLHSQQSDDPSDVLAEFKDLEALHAQTQKFKDNDLI